MTMTISLPRLPFAVSALEPHISRSTINLHYRKHHAGYVARTSELAAAAGLADLPLEALIHTAHEKGERALFNNAAQAWNHAFYWNSLHPDGGGSPTGAIAALIERDFGTQEQFLDRLHSAAIGVFGSGWAWVVLNGEHLEVTQTGNAVNPLVEDQIPLLVIDVWEHAYYLDYRNLRAEYAKAILEHLINWEFANDNLESAASRRTADAPRIDRAARKRSSVVRSTDANELRN
jgi:Fe-Mn family superoxide dismutase